jgi:hypothetical protein
LDREELISQGAVENVELGRGAEESAVVDVVEG